MKVSAGGHGRPPMVEIYCSLHALQVRIGVTPKS